jgi:hypothetical protein
MLASHKIYAILRVKINYINGEKKILRTKPLTIMMQKEKTKRSKQTENLKILKLQEHNKHFEAPRLEQELIHQYFRKPIGKEPGEFISIALALQIVGIGITQKISSVLLGRAFAELGFERKTSRNVRGYIAIRRSSEEMRALRSAMAQETEHTDTDDTEVF